MKTEYLDLRLMDNMDLMRQFPDKHFDLAIVDPPYGLGNKLAGGTWSVRYQKRGVDWDVVPKEDYWVELFRVCKNWIVWGGNYFSHYIPPARNFITWHKPNLDGMHSMSNVELALTSFDKNSKLLRLTSQTEAKNRFHVCQKPVALYNWLLQNYAKEGDKILDTHMGAGAIAIACHYRNCYLTACESDPEYFQAAIEWIERETAQLTFFNGEVKA